MAVKPMNLVGAINILDRGDGPAQEVLSRTARNRAQRQQDETRNELTKITDRVDKTLGQFDLVAQAEEEAKNNPESKVAYVNDLDELYAILSNPIAKRKYLQHATEIIVGFQDKCSRRFKLMQQVNEFFNDTTNRMEEEDDLSPSSPDIDLDEVQQSIVESLDTAKTLTVRIAELNKEMIDCIHQSANAKAGNKNRKKLEKALSQAKDDVQLMSEKLLAVSKELEEKDEKIQALYRQVEVKTMEVQRFKTAAEVAKKAVQESAAKGDDMAVKDREIKELQKKVDKMTLELMQKEESRESSQRELLSTGRENVLKIRELEDKLSVVDAKHQSEIRDANEFNEKQLVKLSNTHREEIQQLKAEYEKEIAALKLSNDKQSAEIQDIGSKFQELDQLRNSANDELNVTKASLEAQLVKEADLINEKEALLRKIADLIQPTPSVRSVSASSSQVSEALKSDIDKDVKGRAGAKKKGKGSDSVAEEEVAPAAHLEPEPAEVRLPDDFEVEEKWASYPMNQTQSAFAQYREFTQHTVKELNMKVLGFEKDADKKVKTLKSQFNEHKNKWYSERSLLIKQIELSQKQTIDAEKDADGALAQLEEFVSEAEQLEREEEGDALKRQASMLAAKKPPTPEKEPTPLPEMNEAEEELMQQTDDAKAELRSRDGQEQSAPNSRKGRRSVTFTEDVTSIRPVSSSVKSSLSDRHQVFERIISNLQSMMREESLDVVQKNALSSLRASIKGSNDESADNTEHSLAMFSLASQISAESVYLGYKPDSLFTSILSMYYQAVEEYNATVSKLAADEGPVISDLTKLLTVQHDRSPASGLTKSVTPERYSPPLEDTDSAKFRIASAVESLPPRTPTSGVDSSLQQQEIDIPESGRSTPHSRLSSKYRASVEQARQSIAERRSTSPRLPIPDKASFENAELDENAETPFLLDRLDRSTSIGSSLYANIQAGSSRSVSVPKSAMTTSAKTRDSSACAPSPAASVPAATSQTPALSVYDKGTSVTPMYAADRTTSYSLSKTPAINEDDLVSREMTPQITDNPLVNEYIKLYNNVLIFKDVLAKILLDKDMMSPSQVLSEIETKPLDEDQPIVPQIEQLGLSSATLLTECGLVVQDALQAAFRDDYNVSSVVSRATSYAGEPTSRANSYALAPVPPAASPTDKRSSGGLKRGSARSMRATPADSANNFELQQTVQKLQEDLQAEVQSHEADINHHTAMVMELQDTVAELRRELALMKEQAEEREAEHSDQESPIMFTRLDAERNAKNLKRALNNNKLTEDKYHAAVEKMDAYVSLPAKRLSELVKKYVHHKNMLRIEDIIKNRHNLDDSDMDMLERMESLQNLRTKRWIDKMDELAERRSELASELMASLEELEQESGIFMIKPMFSYRASLLSFKNLKPQRSEEPVTQRLGVPVPSQPEPTTADRQSNVRDTPQTRWATHTPKTAGGTWNLSASLAAAGGDNVDMNLINTPRILELDVNRMMYGQNQVSMKSNPYLSNDRLVNAANSSVRSYMTVRRPVATNNRPSSSGALITSKSMGALPDAPKRSDSAEAMFALRTTPPLPPIARNNAVASPPDTAERLDTGRDSSVNPSRLARDFTDDSIHLLPSHVTKIVTNSKSLSREDLLVEEPVG